MDKLFLALGAVAMLVEILGMAIYTVARRRGRSVKIALSFCGAGILIWILAIMRFNATFKIVPSGDLT